MKRHEYKAGDTVYFFTRENYFVEGEVIETHGPWLWITDGGEMYTEHYSDVSEDPEKAEMKPEIF